MDARPGYCTAGTPSSGVPSLGSPGRRRSPTLKSWIKPRQRAPKQCPQKTQLRWTARASRQDGGTAHVTPTALWRAGVRQPKPRTPSQALQGLPQREPGVVRHQTIPAQIRSARVIQLVQHCLTRKAAATFEEDRHQRLTATHRAASVTKTSKKTTTNGVSEPLLCSTLCVLTQWDC